jgi:hypothetical protein
MDQPARYPATLLVIYLLLLAGCQPKDQSVATTTVVPAATTGLTATIPIQLTPVSTLMPTPTREVESTVGLSPLTVESNLPNAHIYLNQEEVGRTPYSALWPAGAYTVTAVLPGFHPWQYQLFLDENEPATLAAEFSFEPEIEKLIDHCVQSAWWSDDGNSVYYVRCSPSGTSFRETGQRYEEGPVWRLDLTTREISQVEDAWPPEWVTRLYQDIVPNSIPPWLISVSPSGQRVLYLEEVSQAAQPTLTTTPVAPQDLGPNLTLAYYTLRVVLDRETVLDLGVIDTVPDRISWSQDEQFIFIATSILGLHEHYGWFMDIQTKEVISLVPPVQGISTGEQIGFMNATLSPDGEAILYLSPGENHFRLWYFKTGETQELAAVGYYGWVEPNRYLWFSNQEGFFWYDILMGTIVTVLDETSLPGMWAQRLSPQGDKMLFKQFSLSTGDNLNGLWLLTLDSQ